MNNPYKDFDEYGLRHMPEHLIDLEQWDTLEVFLTDLYFIEAKCAAGMTYELIANYAAALDALPDSDAQEERRVKWERERRVQKYIEDLVAYAKHEIDTLEIIPAVEPWSKEHITTHIERIKSNPTRFDHINAFAQFVNAESDVLAKFAAHSGFVVQHAYNSANSGPIVRAAEILLNETHDVQLLSIPSIKPTYNPLPVLMKTLEGHRNVVKSVSITPDGRRAISGGGSPTRTFNKWESDYALRVWNLEDGRCLRILEGHTGGIESVSITPDGRRAISGSCDSSLLVWDLENGRCLHRLKGHTGGIESVSITPDGRRAVSGAGNHDHTLRVWDLENGRCLHVLKGHTGSVTSVSITPDGRRVVSGGADHTLRVWDLEDGRCLRILEGHTNVVRSVSITPDGRRAVSSEQDTLRVWDLENGRCLHILEVYKCGDVSITPDGRRAILVGYKDYCNLRVWDLENGHQLHIVKGHTHSTESVSITPDGRYAVSGGGKMGNENNPQIDCALRVWDLEHSIYLPTVADWNVKNVNITPDGRHAISRNGGYNLQVWNLENGRCLHILKGHTHGVKSVSITPDGRRAVSGSVDHTLRVWNLENGSCLHVLEGHTDTVNSVSVTPDGRYAMSGSDDKTLRVWDIEYGICLRTSKGHRMDSLDGYFGKDSTAGIQQIYITPDGRHPVSISKYDRYNQMAIDDYLGPVQNWWDYIDDDRFSEFQFGVDVWNLRQNIFLQTFNNTIELLLNNKS